VSVGFFTTAQQFRAGAVQETAEAGFLPLLRLGHLAKAMC